MYLNMNLLDLHRWEHGVLLAFAVPHDPDDVVQAGDVLCIKEPFKRITIKNAELLHDWWKQHYKSTLKDCNDPMVVLLHIKPHTSK